MACCSDSQPARAWLPGTILSPRRDRLCPLYLLVWMCMPKAFCGIHVCCPVQDHAPTAVTGACGPCSSISNALIPINGNSNHKWRSHLNIMCTIGCTRSYKLPGCHSPQTRGLHNCCHVEASCNPSQHCHNCSIHRFIFIRAPDRLPQCARMTAAAAEHGLSCPCRCLRSPLRGLMYGTE